MASHAVALVVDVEHDAAGKQMVFACASCGYEADADINAARNICAAGIAVAGRGGTPYTKPIRAEHGGPVKRQPAAW